MRIKVLRYAAGRDDRIVSAFENVVFETPQAGWYVESRAGEGRCGLDALALVERVGEVAFVVDVRDRNTLMPEHIRAVTDEALHLRQRMQRSASTAEHGFRCLTSRHSKPWAGMLRRSSRTGKGCFANGKR